MSVTHRIQERLEVLDSLKFGLRSPRPLLTTLLELCSAPAMTYRCRPHLSHHAFRQTLRAQPRALILLQQRLRERQLPPPLILELCSRPGREPRIHLRLILQTRAQQNITPIQSPQALKPLQAETPLQLVLHPTPLPPPPPPPPPPPRPPPHRRQILATRTVAQPRTPSLTKRRS